jgi:hypothetical protein
MAAPTQAGADIQQAARHLAEGQPVAAIDVLERLTAAFPAYVTAHVLLAKAYETAARPSDALQAWHRAYFLMPGSSLISRQRSRLLQRVVPEMPAAGEEPASTPPAETTAPPEADGNVFPAGEPHEESEWQAFEADSVPDDLQAFDRAADPAEAEKPDAHHDAEVDGERDVMWAEDDFWTSRAPKWGSLDLDAEWDDEAGEAKADTDTAEVLPPLPMDSSGGPGTRPPPGSTETVDEGDESGWRLLDEDFEREPTAARAPAEAETEPEPEAQDVDLSGEAVELAWDEDTPDGGVLSESQAIPGDPDEAWRMPPLSEGLWIDEVELGQEERVREEDGAGEDEPATGPHGYFPADDLMPTPGTLDYDDAEVDALAPGELEELGFGEREKTPPQQEEGQIEGKTGDWSSSDFFDEVSDLDELIEMLENAPRLRPVGDEYLDDDVEGEAGGEVVSETLARIYETQQQYAAAARAYASLAREHPERTEEFEARAAEMRRRAAG